MTLPLEVMKAMAEDNREARLWQMYAQAAPEAAAAQALEAELAQIRRRNLSPLEKSRLIDKLGVDGYLALPYGEPDQPRDGNGPYRSR